MIGLPLSQPVWQKSKACSRARFGASGAALWHWKARNEHGMRRLRLAFHVHIPARVLSGKTVWELPDPNPNWGGTMATDGGLMFYGSLGGDFRAVDRNSSKILCSRKLGSGIIGNPITYKVGGKQYIATYSGIGGWTGLLVTAGLDLSRKLGAIGATAMTKAAGRQHIPQGCELNLFRIYE